MLGSVALRQSHGRSGVGCRQECLLATGSAEIVRELCLEMIFCNCSDFSQALVPLAMNLASNMGKHCEVVSSLLVLVGLQMQVN